jgi:hypothetical protein
VLVLGLSSEHEDVHEHEPGLSEQHWHWGRAAASFDCKRDRDYRDCDRELDCGRERDCEPDCDRELDCDRVAHRVWNRRLPD